MLLFSSDVDYFANISRRDLKDRLLSPDQMLHVLILSGIDKRPHQVLFLGDRILNIDSIRASLGLHDLAVDARFHDTDFEGGYLRIAPMQDIQGCITYVDHSVLEKDVINIASINAESGNWVNTIDLLGMFSDVKSVSVSTYLSVDGMNMGDSEEFNTRTSQISQLREHMISRPSKKYIFESSKNEIATLYSCGGECIEIEEITDLLKTDCFLYSYVYEHYLSQGGIKARSINEVVASLGKNETLQFLYELVTSESSVDTRKIDFKLGRQMYNFQCSVSFVMDYIVNNKLDIGAKADPKLAGHLGHLCMLPMISWMNIIDGSEFCAYSEKCSVNSHRFSTEIQESIIGFNQFDALSLVCVSVPYPKAISDVLLNSNSPFYMGENSFYANLMYVVMATLVKRKFASNHLFEPVGNTDKVLAKRLDIEKELNGALKSLSKIQDSIARKEWRFFDNVLSKRSVLKIPAAHYMFVK